MTKPAPVEEFLVKEIKCKVQFVDINRVTASYKYRIWINGTEKCPI